MLGSGRLCRRAVAWACPAAEEVLHVQQIRGQARIRHVEALAAVQHLDHAARQQEVGRSVHSAVAGKPETKEGEGSFLPL